VQLKPSDSGTFVEAARRAQLAEAAIRTIAELGYAKTSFVQIAARAGVSPGLVTYHFKTKRRLMQQIVRMVQEDMERTIEASADAAEDHRGGLRALINGYVRYCAEHPQRLIAVARIEDNDNSGESNREAAIEDFAAMLRDGQRAGEFRAFAVRPMAVTLLAALEVVPVELAARPDTDVGGYADMLVDAFERAIVADPTRQQDANR
jgi:AcrR family transcriptional regulator